MQTRHVLAIFTLAATLSSTQTWAKDKGYRFHPSSGQCINQDGKIGFNKKFFGECGDITAIKLFRKRKIRKADLAYANLRGIQINGLDFSEKDLRGADLTGANLLGTDLSQTNLSGANLAQAKFNQETRLPFDAAEAAERGMLSIEFIDERLADDGLINDILLESDSSDLDDRLSELRRPQENYHARIRYVFDRAARLSFEQISSFMQAAYSQREELNELYDEYAQLEASDQRDQDHFEEVKELLDLQRQWADFANGLLLEAFQNKIDLGQLSPAQALILAARAVPFSNNNRSELIFEHVKTKHPLDNVPAMIAFISAANHSGAFNQAGVAAALLYKERGDYSIEQMLEMAEEFFVSRSEGVGKFFAGALENFETLDTADLLRLTHRAKKNGAAVIAAGLSKISSLTVAQTQTLLSATVYDSRDLILQRFFALNESVSFQDFTSLLEKAYQMRNSILKNHFKKIVNLTPENSADLIQLATYAGRDEYAHAYFTSLETKITAQQFADIARHGYQQTNKLLVDHLHLVSNLDGISMKMLSEVATFEGKDNVILRFLGELQGKLNTADLIALARNAYHEHNKILAQYLANLSDLSPANVSLLAQAASFAGKNAVIDTYITQFSPALTTAQLINLSLASYQNGDVILTRALSLLTDLNAANILLIMETATYGTKDQLLATYLSNNVQTIDAQTLIRLARATSQSVSSTILGNLTKVSPFDLNAALTMAAALSYDDKDQVLKRYLDAQATIALDDLLKLADASNQLSVKFKTEYLGKINDLSHANILRLAASLTYDNIDLVLAYYLQQTRSLSTQELESIARAAYQKSRDFISSNLSKVNNLSVANALTLQGFFTYGAIDTYLLQALELVSDLNQENLQAIGEASYQSKERILRRGMERLGLAVN